MRRLKVIAKVASTAVLLGALVLGMQGSALAANGSTAGSAGNEVTVLFTNDLHSHFIPSKQLGEENPGTVGGFARIQTLIEQKRAQGDILLVDAGDFSMGTLFQTLFTSQASELCMLGDMGYDATTLGNHEFDYGTQGLADMLHTAAEKSDHLPQLLFNPANFEFESHETTATPLEDLSDAFAAVGTKRTMVVEKNGVKIGIFSAFGEQSIDFAPLLELDIPTLEDNAKEAVAELKAEGVDMIVCLSHSGTDDDPKKSEDELLAKAVPEIDLIVSGHTHTFIYEPIVVGHTTVVSSGEYGQCLGDLTMERNGDRWKVKNYKLVSVDDTIANNERIAGIVSGYEDLVTSEYLSKFGYSAFDSTVGTVDYPDITFDVYEHHGESHIGDLVSDAFVHAVNQAEVDTSESDAGAADGPTINTDALIAIEPAGVIRWGIAQGDISLADVFNVCSLGNGPDDLAGYPLMDVYLTGAELRNVAEVDASVAPLMAEAQLYGSGMGWEFNPNRVIFNRVTDVWVTDIDGHRVEIEPDQLYRVVVNTYSARMLGSVKDKSFGLLSITPKDENGNEITNIDSRILTDANGAEIKEWSAVANYIASFKDSPAYETADGTSHIPDYYREYHDRKIVNESHNPLIYVTHLNAIALGLYGIVVLLILLIVLVVWLVLRRRKKKRAAVEVEVGQKASSHCGRDEQ